jgi:hypothetical protein
MKRVILESPYAGDVHANVAYARACVRDSLLRGEAPIASHLLYTQPGVLDDSDEGHRKLGITAGLAWGKVAEMTVVYTDLGISPGMTQGIDRAKEEGRSIEYRSIWSRPCEPSRDETLRKLISLRDVYADHANRTAGWDAIARNAAIRIWLDHSAGPLVIGDATGRFIETLIEVVEDE